MEHHELNDEITDTEEEKVILRNLGSPMCEVEGCTNAADCTVLLDSGKRVNVCAECLTEEKL